MTFNHEGTNSLRFSIEVKIGGFVFKNDSSILEKMHCGLLIVEMGLQMVVGHIQKYTSIMKNIESSMGYIEQ